MDKVQKLYLVSEKIRVKNILQSQQLKLFMDFQQYKLCVVTEIN
jgi:hypothetical protein